MKQPLNEQFRRMQKLAGIIIQEAVNPDQLGIDQLDDDQLKVYADEGQVTEKATFVTISSKGNVAEYKNFQQLVQGLQEMPPLGLESAENDLTDGEIVNAKNLFRTVKAKLDGTKDYILIARASERDNLDNELYIWGTRYEFDYQEDKIIMNNTTKDAILNDPELQDFITPKSFVMNDKGEIVLWVDWMDYDQFDKLAKFLGIKY